MLTAVDIHYLVGILSRLTSPKDVEIELGSFVWDTASTTHRDVDITVTARNPDGSVATFKGIEVKAHGRKLGSEVVEQLAQKLNDMTSISHKGIVSASGFTRPAIRKAQYHGVDLYELKDWKPESDLEHFKHILSSTRKSEGLWSKLDMIQLNPSNPLPSYILDELQFNPQTLITTNSDAPTMEFNSWLDSIVKHSANQLINHPDAPQAIGVTRRPVRLTASLSEPISILCTTGKVTVTELRVEGEFEWQCTQMQSEFKGLMKLGDKHPIAGCCVSDFGDFLCSVALAEGRIIEFTTISLNDRNKNKISRLRLNPIQKSNP